MGKLNITEASAVRLSKLGSGGSCENAVALKNLEALDLVIGNAQAGTLPSTVRARVPPPPQPRALPSFYIMLSELLVILAGSRERSA